MRGRINAVLLAWTLLLFGIGIPQCGQRPAPPPSSDNQLIEITESPEFDAGLIDQGATVEHAFEIHNVGDRALALTRVESSCGCLSTTVDPWHVDPGMTSRVRMVVAADKGPGLLHVTSAIYDELDPVRKSPVVVLAIKAICRFDWVAYADPVKLDFGDVALGSVVKQEGKIAILFQPAQCSGDVSIALYGGSEGPLTFVARTEDAIDADETSIINSDNVYGARRVRYIPFECYFSPNANSPRTFALRPTVRVSYSGKIRDVTLSVVGRVIQRVTSSESQLVFRDLVPSVGSEVTIPIALHTEGDLHSLRVTSSTDWLTGRIDPGDGRTGRLIALLQVPEAGSVVAEHVDNLGTDGKVWARFPILGFFRSQ